MPRLKQTRQDRIFDFVNYILLGLMLLAVLYPLYFIVIASVSDPNAINSGQVWFWPKNLTFEGYERILGDSAIWRGYRNSILYTALGTTINVFHFDRCLCPIAERLAGRNLIMFSSPSPCSLAAD